MPGSIGLWSHLLAALLYGALAIFQLRHWNGDPRNRPLVSAFAVVAVWTIFLGLLDGYAMLTQLAESARNLAFLAFMYGIMREADADGDQRGLKAVFASVAAVIGLQIVIGGVMPQFRGLPLAFEALVSTSQIFGLTIAAGALILVHNIYGQAAPHSRGMLKFPMLALAAMWAYDLHLYTVDYFTHGMANDLFALRGIILALIVPLFALGMRQAQNWKIQLSRAATFQSVSLIAILAYLIAMMSASRAMEVAGGDWGRAAEIAIIAAMTALALVLIPSGRARAWLRVFLAKHVFEHRYDYRREWLRFIDTVGRERAGGAALEERIVKALADIGGAEGGLLLFAGDHYRLSPAASWNWPGEAPVCGGSTEALLRFVEEAAWVLDFEKLAAGRMDARGQQLPVPVWLAGLERAWAGVPLIHAGKLVGLVILAHPAFRRPLDWEDIDLFRTAGIQAASYLAEAKGQQALADARRFDEFNRRFAFIIHDIKNLVSQLSLVARNTERHADNPEFRADMIATLQSSVRKMNDLLVRLSPGAKRLAEAPRAAPVGRIVEAVARAKDRVHPVTLGGETALEAFADAAALEQALAHLVQNAIDASEPGMPVAVRVFESGGDVAIEVSDRGQGMSSEFVRTRLFQPFASTKEAGFGIGAYEARALIAAMGGRLDVESAEGEGTCFTIFLPGAVARARTQAERIRA